jgi:trans-2,3-dihydro-3-hydroxyanthranilate isomerase
VRIFTPGEEVPFAGHPTLGTAYVIAREILRRPVEKVVLNLKVGQIPVKFERQGEAETLWMKQVPPAFGRTFDLGVTARCLGLPEEDIDDRFPVQDVSTGLPFIIAPVRSLGAVRRCRPTHNDLLRLTEGTDSKAVVVFARETYNADNHLNVRVFTDLLGIPEDPATGSGNGCLAGYLSKYRFFGSGDVSCRVEQGYEIGRPSLLYLKSRPEGASIAVEVGGSVVMVAKGELV